MLFSPSPKVCRSWLWTTPYPKSLSKLVIGHTCSTHAHLLPKVCRSWLLGTLHPNHYPHAQLHINSHTSHTIPPIHQLYTHHTQSHNPPHTPPPASWQRRNVAKTGRFLAHEALECSRASTKWTPRVVQTRLELARCLFVASAGANEGGWGVRPVWVVSESCQVCAVKVPANLTVFPKITQTVKKLPNSPTYHLMVTNFTEFHRISPDHCRYHLMPPNERKTHA